MALDAVVENEALRAVMALDAVVENEALIDVVAKIAKDEVPNTEAVTP
jgi:hypothetical protein